MEDKPLYQQITTEEYKRYVARINELPSDKKTKSTCIGCKNWIHGENGNHCKWQESGEPWWYCKRL